MNGLAATTFEAGAKQALAAADVYDVNNPGTINSIVAITNDTTVQDTEVIRATKKPAESLFKDFSSSKIASADVVNGAASIGPKSLFSESSVSKIVSDSKIAEIYSKASNPTEIMAGINTAASKVATGLSAFNSLKAATSAPGSMLSRISNTSSVLTGALKLLPTATGDSILSGINGAAGNILVTVGNVTRSLSPADASNISAIGRSINAIGCNPNGLFGINDPSSLLGALMGLGQRAMGIGIPNSFGSLLCNLTSTNGVDRLANGVIGQVTRYSDTGSLRTISTHTTPGFIGMTNPNLLGDFSKNYKAPMMCTADQQYDEYTSVMGATSSINSLWNKSNRGGEEVFNMSQLTNPSADFKKLIQNGAMQATDTASKLQLLAEQQRPSIEATASSVVNSDLFSKLKNFDIGRQFPNVAIMNDSSRGSFDPRVISI